MPKTSNALDRFWAKVDKTGDCWVWTASTRTNYGCFVDQNTKFPAHRWIYGQLVEPLVPGLTIDHLCKNTLCVRPDHLEQVTMRENNRRSNSPSAISARATACPQGHPFDEANTRIRSTGHRQCRTCYRAKLDRYIELRREARAKRAA